MLLRHPRPSAADLRNPRFVHPSLDSSAPARFAFGRSGLFAPNLGFALRRCSRPSCRRPAPQSLLREIRAASNGPSLIHRPSVPPPAGVPQRLRTCLSRRSFITSLSRPIPYRDRRDHTTQDFTSVFIPLQPCKLYSAGGLPCRCTLLFTSSQSLGRSSNSAKS